jgi:hypothetical protein
MDRDSHMRERIFFTHSDPHGAAPSHGRFLTGMPDDDLLQRPIVASEGGGGEISPCCRCEIQGFQEEGAVQNLWRQTTPACVCVRGQILCSVSASGLENVVFNDFLDDELDSEDVSEQRAYASLPDSVPIESEEERAAREADEMAALDSVGDYEADPNVMLEDVPQDIVIKTLKVSCACVPVLVFACVCVRACTRRRYVFVRICIRIF